MMKVLQIALVSLGMLATSACSDDGPTPLPPRPDGDIVVPTFDAGVCDPLAQDCPGAEEKCSLSVTQTAAAETWVATCRPETGTAASGETCTRTELGQDTCGAG